MTTRGSPKDTLAKSPQENYIFLIVCAQQETGTQRNVQNTIIMPAKNNEHRNVKGFE